MKHDFQIDFILIGAQKSATSWIFQCLKEHPEICGSSLKEAHFFDREENYNKGSRFYQSYFKACKDGQIKGEATPKYLTAEGAAKRIFDAQPEVKLIACLRNPVERALSQYRYRNQRRGLFTKDLSLEEMVKEFPGIVENGLYYKNLKRYFDIFPEEKILVAFYEDIQKDPAEFISHIYQFLGVKRNFAPPSLDKRINPTDESMGKHKIPTLSRGIYSLNKTINRGPLRKTAQKVAEVTGLRSIGKKIVSPGKVSSQRPDEKLNEEALIKLYKRFEGDIANLERLLGRGLPSWKEPYQK